ncbi:MAG: PAAR domain-containing protein [Polyangiaceae bacterium]
MPLAARLGDDVQHSSALLGLMAGLAIGIAVGVFVVATGGLGGIVAAAVIGGAACTGAGIGEAAGSLSVAPGIVTGALVSGSGNVHVNGILVARATLDSTDCKGTPPLFYLPSHAGKRVATGSGTVLINSQPAARVGDKLECGSSIKGSSSNVNIGGGTVQTLDIDSEVPGWIHAGLFVVGLASAVVLAGPVVAVLGTLGSMGGGYLAQSFAARMGWSQDAQILSGLLGSFAGGWAGGRAGMRVNAALARAPGSTWLQQNARYQVAREFYQTRGSTFDPTLNGGRGGMRPMNPAEINSALRGVDFAQPVEVVNAPTNLTSWQQPGGRQGNYYAEPGTTPNQLGIGDYGGGTGTPVFKENWGYTAGPETPALQSTAGPITDTWSNTVPQPTTGGGTQYYVPDKNGLTLVPGSGTPMGTGQMNPGGPIAGAPVTPPTGVGAPPVTGSPPVQGGYWGTIWGSPQATAPTGAGMQGSNLLGDPDP